MTKLSEINSFHIVKDIVDLEKKVKKLNKEMTYIFDNFMHSETVERYTRLEEKFKALDNKFEEYEEKQRQRIKSLSYQIDSLTIASLKGDLEIINKKMESYK